ncbi:TPA: hypothetical protein ACIYE1_005295 [Escherichia coli]|uniref:Uncharacterized protein n=1 Tax=Escherichia coli TaxID=562 RepID=A0AAP8ASX1_ECOLX|nr:MULTISPECIES: hypothetical protein [Enterobacteriaceae]EAO7838421.1 hypothetical protein [Salmonella enterica]EHS0498213.1 hypothetical protein [Escherichia coli O26]MEA1753502.1 hypothetical protein [Salmonella enterica subsp. enterica serovar Minnesota]EDK8633380.1 hypothetical protein [Salmonella enterica]EEQ2186796.1 hypothetical protein [Escherichia coli]
MHRIPGEIPHHKTKNIKLMAIVHRLQQIMVNENLTPDELVGCAQIVRDNYERLNDMIQLGTFQPTIPFWGQPR